jgi:phage replication-related protein YjqB (UPF0714/DUF867 family)
MKMSKTNVDRIRFYTRKANEFSAASFDRLRGRPHKRINSFRFDRLLAYKKALNEKMQAVREI